jgi:hypothetical protein
MRLHLQQRLLPKKRLQPKKRNNPTNGIWGFASGTGLNEQKSRF